MCREISSRNFEVILFEPQLRFKSQLYKLVNKYGGKYHKAIAWIQNDTLPFFFSDFSEASSILEPMARAFNKNPRSAVQKMTNAIDIAHVLKPYANHNPVILRMDAEGSEYSLIPYMLVRGMFCTMTSIIIEWHLNSLKEDNRLNGVLLRHTFDTLIGHCPEKPFVEHDEDFLNNHGLGVPALQRLSAKYNMKIKNNPRKFSQAHAHT